MQLTSALGLKSEILWRLPARMRKRGEASLQNAIAIGIASATPDDYGIAARARSHEALTATVMALLETMTKGELDVRVTGPIVPSSAPLRAGSSTGHRRGDTGTLGFFARRNSDQALGFVSNNHVIAAEDEGVEGDAIIAPAKGDGGKWPADVIGHLAGNYPRLRNTKQQTVDCAFALLADGVDIERIEPVYDVIPPAGKTAVFKVGRSTGHTTGILTAFALDDLLVDYSFGTVRFNGQIELQSHGASPFSERGDSGSLILTEAHEPLALLFACSEAGGAHNSGLTYANPLRPVLDSLGVTLVG